MKTGHQNWLVSLLLVVSLSFPTGSVRADRGVPGSLEFGYGAILYPEGDHLEEAIAIAEDLGLDWIELPIDWRNYEPTPGQYSGLNQIDFVIQKLYQRDISVLFSVAKAPEWALTPDGPDPELVANFVSALAKRYAGFVQAIELFPGANTHKHWQGQVNPLAYYQLYQVVRERLEQEKTGLLLIAGGLQPLSRLPFKSDMQDLVFLQGLYDLGAAGNMPIISLQFIDMIGDPTQLSTDQEARVLRRYEVVRKLMVDNQHETGLIWITRFCPPSGKINIQDSDNSVLSIQSVWLSQSYLILRSQLYVGVGFLPSLNSFGEGAEAEVLGLIQNDGTIHPFYSDFRMLIGPTRSDLDGFGAGPGKAKQGNLVKKRPR